MTSEIRTNSLKSRAGLSTVTMTDSGPMFSGITTFVDNSGFTFGVGGGTSIFTPATNVLTFGTNNTEKVRIDANGNTNISGVTTAANFKTGVSNLHDVGLTLSGGQIDVGSNIKIGTAGVVTATSFVGDGSNLTGLTVPGGAINLDLLDSSGTGNGRIRLGASQDLQIYHDGSHSWFKNTTGRLLLQTDGDQIQLRGNTIVALNGAASTEYLRISSNGNISINNSSGLSSTYSSFKHFSINNNLILNAPNSAGGFSGMQNNAYLNSSGNWVRVNNDHATSIGTDDGNFYFRNAGAGTGNITWNQVLNILANGNIGINQTSPAVLFHASKSYSAPTGGFDSNIVAAFTNSGSNSYAGLAIQGGSGAGSFIHFGDTDDSNTGIINYEHSDNSFRFTVNTDQRLKLTHADTTLYGTTDGVLNITTTDSRGSFIRFQESASTKVWVGCGQGLSLGGVNDLGLRATNDIRMRSGSEMHAVLTADGYFAAKGMAGSWASSNTDPASSQFHQFTQTGTGKRVVVFRQEHHAGLGVHIEMSNTGNQESLYCTGNGATKFRVLNNGSVGSANNSYGGISDVKLKENIVEANSQWNDIKAVKVRNFNFKDTPDTKMLGVVAQEIETISPGLISEVVDKDPNTNEPLKTTTKEVKYSILYMKAIKALQEAMTRIETLEQDNIALRARVTNLEGN